MNQKKVKLLKKKINEIIPISNIVGRNVYRNIKKCYSKHIMPGLIDNYVDRYEFFYKTMENDLKNKYKRLVSNAKTKDTRVL